jgi:rhodanese-related sulfurtransferase
MQFVAHNWYLFLALFVVLFLLVWPMLRQVIYGIHTISNAEAVRLLNHEQAVVVDVRENDEFNGGHIPKAVHVPLSGLRSGLTQLEKYKSRPVIVCCRTSQRSAHAAVMLRQQQFANVRVLGGGMNGWQSDNLPVEK